jgi:hypothetical protein
LRAPSIADQKPEHAWFLAPLRIGSRTLFRLGLIRAFGGVANHGDCGFWSHGNKQLRESFAADSRSQAQWDSRRYPFGERRPHSAFRIPHSAIRISHQICKLPLPLASPITDY